MLKFKYLYIIISNFIGMLFSSIAKVKFKLLSLDNKKKYMYMCLLVYGD